MDQVFHRGIALADLLEGMADELAAAIEDESHEAGADELI
jgi:hypothetical protein